MMIDRDGVSEQQRAQFSDAYELLSTKLALPRPHQSLVPRESLLARLDEGLEHGLTLLSAPAGFGKTTLASEWIATRGELRNPPTVAWVSLDEGDNDPARFWRYVITACRVFDVAIGTSALELLHTSRRLPLEAVLTMFINDLARIERDCVLVLEDYHVIALPQIEETVAYLIDHLPVRLHMMILTRSDPSLPLARLRAHDDLYELHASDLRFSLAETRAFLQQTLAFPLSASAIERLEARTEGWVTGLRLLALALQGRKDPQDLERMLVTFSGSQRHILEYLVADVLSSQPKLLQDFLLHTAFLNRLTASLCDAVIGRDDSEQMLVQLERANLFLMPLDDTGKWYRYHALFAEAMQHEARRRLGEDYLRPLYDKARQWYEEHGLLAEAIEAALSVSDFQRAATLIEGIISPQNTNNELQTFLRWIGQLPEDVLQPRPMLCLAYAAALLFTSDRSDPATMALTQEPLEMAERYWRAEDNMFKLGEVQAFRSQVAWWQGDFSQAVVFARQALDMLPEQDYLWGASALLVMSTEEELAGKPFAARPLALKAQAFFETNGNPFGARAATLMLTELYMQQGELHQAERFYRQVLADATEDPVDMATALTGLAALSYEWNDLQEAEQQLLLALDLCQRHANDIGRYYAEQAILVPASLALARVLHARGETTKARELLQELIMLTQEHRWPYLYREVLVSQARLALDASDLAAVQRWSIAITQLGEDFRFIQQEREALIIARLLIAQGEPEAALQLLDRWQEDAHAQGRSRSELEILVLKTLAYCRTNQHQTQARETLVQALTLARPEGYQHLFLDEGQVMAAALQAVLSDAREEPLATYARTLLYAFARQQAEQNISPSSSPSAPVMPFEPLSAQERRVLRLLAAGRSNPEIAGELIVSINTVKTQTQSIYRKLNVNSRKEAREVARQLKLI
ncbi:MAG TPA: LuxR C-terminal-related transcriptional regulator [Ktedonobacteraceae bacterium]|nr:LuxR C-terminal-related transcriptional regulator [Ktedonobacteraceae bacterium]